MFPSVNSGQCWDPCFCSQGPRLRVLVSPCQFYGRQPPSFCSSHHRTGQWALGEGQKVPRSLEGGKKYGVRNPTRWRDRSACGVRAGRRSKHNVLRSHFSDGIRLAANLPGLSANLTDQDGQDAEELLRKLALTPDNDKVTSSINCTISYTSHYVEVPWQRARGKIRRQSPLGHLRLLPHHSSPSPTRAKPDAVLNRQTGPRPR